MIGWNNYFYHLCKISIKYTEKTQQSHVLDYTVVFKAMKVKVINNLKCFYNINVIKNAN